MEPRKIDVDTNYYNNNTYVNSDSLVNDNSKNGTYTEEQLHDDLYHLSPHSNNQDAEFNFDTALKSTDLWRSMNNDINYSEKRETGSADLGGLFSSSRDGKNDDIFGVESNDLNLLSTRGILDDLAWAQISNLSPSLFSLPPLPNPCYSTDENDVLKNENFVDGLNLDVFKDKESPGCGAYYSGGNDIFFSRL
jgi:hypothetical protein